MKNKIYFIVSMFIFILLYLIIAFITMKINPYYWLPEARGFMCVVGIVGCCMFVGMYNKFKERNENLQTEIIELKQQLQAKQQEGEEAKNFCNCEDCRAKRLLYSSESKQP